MEGSDGGETCTIPAFAECIMPLRHNGNHNKHKTQDKRVR